MIEIAPELNDNYGALVDETAKLRMKLHDMLTHNTLIEAGYPMMIPYIYEIDALREVIAAYEARGNELFSAQLERAGALIAG